VPAAVFVGNGFGKLNNRTTDEKTTRTAHVANDAMSPLFLAVIEATEEAIYNSLFRAETTTGNGKTIEALPVERTLEILRNYNAVASPDLRGGVA
jgi:D-aminopeptidase